MIDYSSNKKNKCSVLAGVPLPAQSSIVFPRAGLRAGLNNSRQDWTLDAFALDCSAAKRMPLNPHPEVGPGLQCREVCLSGKEHLPLTSLRITMAIFCLALVFFILFHVHVVCMCTYVCVCACVHMCVHVCMRVCAYVYVCMYVHACEGGGLRLESEIILCHSFALVPEARPLYQTKSLPIELVLLASFPWGSLCLHSEVGTTGRPRRSLGIYMGFWGFELQY